MLELSIPQFSVSIFDATDDEEFMMVSALSSRPLGFDMFSSLVVKDGKTIIKHQCGDDFYIVEADNPNDFSLKNFLKARFR